eukprot:998700-Rhodomonas_salina.1
MVKKKQMILWNSSGSRLPGGCDVFVERVGHGALLSSPPTPTATATATPTTTPFSVSSSSSSSSSFHEKKNPQNKEKKNKKNSNPKNDVAGG